MTGAAIKCQALANSALENTGSTAWAVDAGRGVTIRIRVEGDGPAEVRHRCEQVLDEIALHRRYGRGLTDMPVTVEVV